MKKTFRVVEMTVAPGLEPSSKTVRANLSQNQAKSLQEKLEEDNCNFTSDQVVSYLVQSV